LAVLLPPAREDATSTYHPSGTSRDPDPRWSRIRASLLRANPEFHEATLSATFPSGTSSALKVAPLVGPAYGRLWEVTYQRPTFFSPDELINVVSAIQWDTPERMILYETPWLYLGSRPRIFSRMSPDLQRIIEKQRRAERNLKGYKTGDPEFDRQWVFYAYRSNPVEVLRDSARRQWLRALADLRPRRGDELPTIASVGTTVALGCVVSDSDATVRQAGTLVQSFSQFLDAVELSTGNTPASRVPLPMDLLPDGTGYPSPTRRLRCPRCGQEAHPRFVPDFQTEICDQCRKGLYDSW
jgi:hypothetical protein